MNDQIIVSVSEVVGFVVLMAFSYFMVMSSIHRHKENKYDERQILARNQAYKTSYIFLLLYLTVCIALEVVDVKWAMFETMILIGIFSSITIFAMICVENAKAFSYVLMSKNIIHATKCSLQICRI